MYIKNCTLLLSHFYFSSNLACTHKFKSSSLRKLINHVQKKISEPKTNQIAKSSILRYHHGGEIPSQHTIDAIATSHHSSGNGALNLIERPVVSGLSLQNQQQPLPLMSQHHHGSQQQHGGTLSALTASLNAAPMQMRPMSGLLGPTSGQIAANQAHITDLSVQS